MAERNLILKISTLENFGVKPVAFLYQDDPRHWIICSHRPAEGMGKRFSVSSMPKRHYTIENARAVLGKALD